MLLDPNAHSIARDAPMLMKAQGDARGDQGSKSTKEEVWKRRKKKKEKEEKEEERARRKKEKKQFQGGG